MRYLLVYRLVAFILSAVIHTSVFADQGEKPFTMNVTLKEIREGKVYFRNTSDDTKGWDSAVIVNGKFSFKGILSDDIVPASLIMNIPVTEAQLAANPFANVSARSFYLTPGKITASGNRLEDLAFSGSREMDAFTRLENRKRPVLEASELAGRNYVRINGMGDFPGKADSLAFYTKIFDSSSGLLKATEKDFIRKYPSSLLSMALVRTMAGQTEVSDALEMESLIAGLAPALRDRSDIAGIRKRMQLLRTLVIGNPALDFSIPDTSGNIVSLASYRGKYVLVEFWASWCGPCRAQTPHLLKSYESFKSRNFDILGVSIDDSKEKWLKAIHQDKLPWTQVSELKGFKSDVALKYGVTGIPLNFLVDPGGIIVAKNLRDDDLCKKLEELLK